MVHKLKLSGHKGAVTCLSHSNSSFHGAQRKKRKSTQNKHPSCLLSGSEDGTSRLWDLRSGTRASLCILSPNREEVTSVGFHPNSRDFNASLDLMGHGQYPFTVFTSTTQGVYAYDLRQATSPIIVEPDNNLSDLVSEEINQMAFATAGVNAYLVVADDDGYARVVALDNFGENRSQGNFKSSDNCKALRHDTTSPNTLVTSVAFRPRSKTLDLAVAGTNCAVSLWDVNRHRRPLSSFSIQRDKEEGANQVCNPPVVHSLSWSPSGRLLAAGLGDGSASIMALEGRKLVESCRLRGGHDSSVSGVLFPQFGGTHSSHVAAEDRLVVTAGTDGTIMLWDIGSRTAGSAAVDPNTMFQDSKVEGEVLDTEGGEPMDEELEQPSVKSSPESKLLFGMNLEEGEKPNWIISSDSCEPVLPNSLFCATTSNDITVFTLPRL
mmetsp:Transcript_11127/g.16880  ORF Transcript_11127/g.16880 Transcript_11127/m.16880 type:complete len:436 (-) Transcript_11127:83-1390(-)